MAAKWWCVSAGPERVGSTIREALAKGADRAIHIVCDDLRQRDALGVARLLAAAIKPENPDLVLTGLQSEDLGLGQTGVIACRAARPAPRHADPARGKDRCRHQGEARARRGLVPDRSKCPLPAVLTMQSGGNKLRYATLMGIKRAKTKEVRSAELRRNSARTPRRWSLLEQIALPKKQKSTQILPGSPKEAAAALVEKLKIEVRVL